MFESLKSLILPQNPKVRQFVVRTLIMGIITGFVYSIYLYKGLSIVVEQISKKELIEEFSNCQIHGLSPIEPREECLSFFRQDAPSFFQNNPTPSTFPFKFVNEIEFYKVYTLVQQDLKKFDMQPLPPLEELSNGFYIGWKMPR